MELSKEELAEIKRYPNWKELLDKQANGKQGGWRGKVNKTDYEEIEYWAEKDHLQKTSSVSKPTITEDDHSKLRRHAKNIGYDDDEIDSVIFTRADIGEQTTQGILEELQDKLSGKAIDNDKPIQTYSAGKIKDLVNKTFSAYTGG